MRFVLLCHASTIDASFQLPFTIFDVLYLFYDQGLYVKKSLNKICSSYKAIMSPQKHNNPIDGSLLQCLYVLFKVLLNFLKVLVEWTLNGGTEISHI